MLKILYLGLLETSNSFYGDAIGLAPIALASSNKKNLSNSSVEEVDINSKTCQVLNRSEEY